MNVFPPLSRTLRHALITTAAVATLGASLPSQATPFLFTSLSQTVGLDVNLTPVNGTITDIAMTFQFQQSPVFLNYQLFSETGGQGTLLASGNNPMALTNELNRPDTLDGHFSVLLTLTTNPAFQTFIASDLAHGGLGGDLAITARVRSTLPNVDPVNLSMAVTAAVPATVPEPGSMALATLAIGAMGAAGGALRRCRRS